VDEVDDNESNQSQHRHPSRLALPHRLRHSDST
jgi:hypothetical protein